MNITLGVSASVAIIKVEELIKKLKAKGHIISLVVTEHTYIFEEVEKLKELADYFYDYQLVYDLNNGVSHIDLAQKTDLILVAPATFNFINKVKAGIADDLLTSIMAAATAPVLIAPAMNTFMLENPILKDSIDYLEQKLNYQFIETRCSMLACGYEGMGAMATVDTIINHVNDVYNKPNKDKNIVVTCGATRVFMDPIRFISNTSSGIMGHEIAKAYYESGANVTCICANTTFDKINGIKYIDVSTPDELLTESEAIFKDADIFVMCAAVSDYKPKVVADKKIKKQDGDLIIELERSVDILYTLGLQKQKQTLVGFAAEDTNHLESGTGKLIKKNLDYIVINDLSAFSKNENKVILLDKEKNTLDIPNNTKRMIAKELVKNIKK